MRVGFIWGLIRLRTRALEMRRRELEQAVAARNAELVDKNRELHEMSLTDPLTRLRNRRYFQEIIEGEVAHVRRAWSASPAASGQNMAANYCCSWSTSTPSKS